MNEILMNKTLREMEIVESEVQARISELRKKGYSDEEILELLDKDEGMNKIDDLIDRIIENLD